MEESRKDEDMRREESRERVKMARDLGKKKRGE